MNLKSSTFYEAILLLVLVCLLSLTLSKQGQKNVEDDGYKRRYHKLLELTEKGVKRLASLNDYQRFRESILKHILRVRVPGTLGHHEVKKFIIRRLQQLEWEVKIDEFDHDTPIGRRRFSNIVATLDPKAERRLVLAAHYDSKLILPDNGRYFVGATDSAVPCAMMLDLAETLHNKLKNRRKVRNVTLQLIFFDGEEAFVEWNEHDSIYGAKHLAEVMSHKPHSHKKGHSDSMTPTMLESMDALILLDLIGAKNPNFYDLYDNTSALYERLRSIVVSPLWSQDSEAYCNILWLFIVSNKVIEKRLAATKQLESYDAFSPYFVGKPRYPGLYIEDDHLPFLRKGVPIMHLIAIPFPDVWHKVTDNEDILDRATIENLLKIFRVFVAEYLHLE